MLASEFALQDTWESHNAPQILIRGSECINQVYVSRELTKYENLRDPKELHTDHKPIQLKLKMKSHSNQRLTQPKEVKMI